jgi:hypothetical protein
VAIVPQTKLFLVMNGVHDGNAAYARMKSEAEVKLYYKNDLRVVSILAGKHFEKLLVVSCPKSGSNTYVQTWGDEPNIDILDWLDHVGLYVEVDGQLVWNDMKPDDQEGHDEDCIACAR